MRLLLKICAFILLILCSCKKDEPKKKQFKEVIGTNGIEYYDGLLWVTDLFGQSITAFDPSTGKIQLQYNFSTISTAPDDLAFLDDGTIFWTAPTQGSIGKISPSGAVQTLQIVGENVNPIAKHPYRNEIYFGFEKSNQYIGTVTSDGNVDQKTTHLPSINGFSFAEDSFLYAPLFDLEDITAPGGVIKIDIGNNSFESLKVTFPDEKNKTQFTSTVATVADLKGSLYVLEALPPKIYKVNLEKAVAKKLARLPSFTADHITIGKDDKIYMTTFITNVVYEIDQSGNKKTIIIKE